MFLKSVQASSSGGGGEGKADVREDQSAADVSTEHSHQLPLEWLVLLRWVAVKLIHLTDSYVLLQEGNGYHTKQRRSPGGRSKESC